MKRLPSDVVSALRTDVTITSAPQCVTELVLNSIDAKSSSIAVRVDLTLFKLQVIDNGCGLSESNLQLLGNRYMTSKCQSLEDLRHNLSSFGFRGEALASLCEVSGTVMITSRAAGSEATFCKTISQGRHQKVVRASQPRPAHGTTVLVGDFLYNRLVRRARIKPAFDLEEIKTHLECTALIHPQISFSLRDDSTGQIILETRKSSSVVDTFSCLFGSAIAKTLCAVKQIAEPFEVSGYISSESHAHKNLQFIYINKRLLLKTKLHKLINSIMARSSILKVNNVPHNPISKELTSAFFLAMSPPKRAKHAVYVLNITCPYAEYDITLDPKKTLIEFRNWDTILNCLEKLLRNFIEPEVTPDSPSKGSSLMEEIDRLAREDALSRDGVCGDITSNLGARSVLSLPARRDAINFTPPSQYTPDTQGSGKESTTVSLPVSSGIPVTCLTNSEDPFPSHLRGTQGHRMMQTASSEDPFVVPRNPVTRNHDFNTTSPETSTVVSTENFLNLFKQPVSKKKLNQPKVQSKLSLGNSVHFDLNLKRITNMIRPPVLTNDLEVERRKRSIFNSLQKFTKEKSSQMSSRMNPSFSEDSAMFRTPENVEKNSPSVCVDTGQSIPDLAHVSDLEARCDTPTETFPGPDSSVPRSLQGTSSDQSVNSDSDSKEPTTVSEVEPTNLDDIPSIINPTSELIRQTDELCDSAGVPRRGKCSKEIVSNGCSLDFSKDRAIRAEIINSQKETESMTANPCITPDKNSDRPTRDYFQTDEPITNILIPAKNYVSSEDFIVTLEDYVRAKKISVVPSEINIENSDTCESLPDRDKIAGLPCQGESSASSSDVARILFSRSSQTGSDGSTDTGNVELIKGDSSRTGNDTEQPFINQCLSTNILEPASHELLNKHISGVSSVSNCPVIYEESNEFNLQGASCVDLNVEQSLETQSSATIEGSSLTEQFSRIEQANSTHDSFEASSSNNVTLSSLIRISDLEPSASSKTTADNYWPTTPLFQTVGTQTTSQFSSSSADSECSSNSRKRSHATIPNLNNQDEPPKKISFLNNIDSQSKDVFYTRNDCQENPAGKNKTVNEENHSRGTPSRNVQESSLSGFVDNANSVSNRFSVILECSILEIQAKSPKFHDSRTRIPSQTKHGSKTSVSAADRCSEGTSVSKPTIIQDDSNLDTFKNTTRLTESDVNVTETDPDEAVSTEMESTETNAVNVTPAIAVEAIVKYTEVDMISTSARSKDTIGTERNVNIMEAYLEEVLSTETETVADAAVAALNAIDINLTTQSARSKDVIVTESNVNTMEVDLEEVVSTETETVADAVATLNAADINPTTQSARSKDVIVTESNANTMEVDLEEVVSTETETVADAVATLNAADINPTTQSARSKDVIGTETNVNTKETDLEEVLSMETETVADAAVTPLNAPDINSTEVEEATDVTAAIAVKTNVQYAGVDMINISTQLTSSKCTETGFDIPSSRNESILVAYGNAMTENNINLGGITKERNTTRSHVVEVDSVSAPKQNSDSAFNVCSLRDESILQAESNAMNEDKKDTEKSQVLTNTAEANTPCSILEHANVAFDITSSGDDAILRAYNDAMINKGNINKTDAVEDSANVIKTFPAQPLLDERNSIGVPSSDAADTSGENWEEHTDSSGRKFFVHSISGAVRFVDLRSSGNQEEFIIQQRCQFIPKGLSPMMGNLEMPSRETQSLDNSEQDPAVSRLLDQFAAKPSEVSKWLDEDNSAKSFPLLDRLLTGFNGNEPEPPVASAMVQDYPQSQIRVYNVCYPYTFDRNVFVNLRVLGQLDHKFIVTVARIPAATETNEVIVLFDQHAVHERIRVEQLTEDYREPGPGIIWRSAPVHPPLPLSLSAREVRVMANCTEKWRALGLRFSQSDAHSVRITGVPTCLLMREDREVHGRGVSVLKSYLESLIREEVDALIQTRGAGVQQPAIIRNVIASEACRGAVKFGHPLEVKECQAFLHNLSACDLPFQCAHGRPALTPIADLSQLQKPTKVQKLNLWRLRSA